jgi:hypothetical protein
MAAVSTCNFSKLDGTSPSCSGRNRRLQFVANKCQEPIWSTAEQAWFSRSPIHLPSHHQMSHKLVSSHCVQILTMPENSSISLRGAQLSLVHPNENKVIVIRLQCRV